MAQSRETMSLVSDYLDEKVALKHFWADMFAESELLLSEKVKVKPLKSADVEATANTLERAAKDDPLFSYLRDAPDVRNPKRYKRAQKLQFTLAPHLWIRRRIAFTVDKGHSVVVALLPKAIDKPSKTDRFLSTLYGGLMSLIQRASESKEQRKRAAEVRSKLEAVVTELLGDAAKEMRTVDSLATDPDFQRRGYGGALVDYITSLADEEGRATYLLSSNPINTEFYNSHGFVEIGKAMIGEGNPTWNAPPLPILLMVRPLEPKISL